MYIEAVVMYEFSQACDSGMGVTMDGHLLTGSQDGKSYKNTYSITTYIFMCILIPYFHVFLIHSGWHKPTLDVIKFVIDSLHGI